MHPTRLRKGDFDAVLRAEERAPSSSISRSWRALVRLLQDWPPEDLAEKLAALEKKCDARFKVVFDALALT